MVLLPAMSKRILRIALLLIAGCGTPSRRLSTRIVDDPMVLPRRMLSMSAGAELGQHPRPHFYSSPRLQVDYGLTDRLELKNLLSLRWAVLDDAPATAPQQRPRDRLSLAVRGGVEGFGVSSTSGFIVVPVASVEVAKHLGENTRLAASVTWTAEWTESPGQWNWIGSYRDDLRPGGSRWAGLEVDTSVLRQLSARVALNVGVGVHQLHGCTFATCSWAARGGSAWLEPSFRPVHWLTLSLAVFAGGRYRPAHQPPANPDAPVAVLPPTISWIGAAADAGFNW